MTAGQAGAGRVRPPAGGAGRPASRRPETGLVPAGAGAEPAAGGPAGCCPVCGDRVGAGASIVYAGLVQLGRHDNQLVAGVLIAPVCIGTGAHVKSAPAPGAPAGAGK